MDDEPKSPMRIGEKAALCRFPVLLVFFVLAIVNSFTHTPLLLVLCLTCLVFITVTSLVRPEDGAHGLKAKAGPLIDESVYLVVLPTLVFLAARNGHVAHATLLLALAITFLMRDQWVTFLGSVGQFDGVSGGSSIACKARFAFTFPLLCLIYAQEEGRGQPGTLAQLIFAAELIAIVLNLVTVYTYTKFYWPSLMKAATLDTDRAHDDTK